MTERQRKILATVVLVIVLAAVAFGCYILYSFNPEEVGFFPKCPTKYVFDVDCPGCGSTRALHAMLHGNWAAAWHYNAGLFFMVPVLALLVVARYLRPGNRLKRIVDSPYTSVVILVAIITWGVLRNIF